MTANSFGFAINGWLLVKRIVRLSNRGLAFCPGGPGLRLNSLTKQSLPSQHSRLYLIGSDIFVLLYTLKSPLFPP